MARLEIGDEARLKIGSLDLLVTIESMSDIVGPGVYGLMTRTGKKITADESILRRNEKSVQDVLQTKAVEIIIRNMYERMTGRSGDPGCGPADLIVAFLG